MTFTDLKRFLHISHIYQPLLIKILLESGSLATFAPIGGGVCGE